MDKRSDKGQTTRQHILSTATRLFTAEGYEATSIEQILQVCGISRGALYHHFTNKEAVFTAILEETEARIAREIEAAARDAKSPLDALRAGCAAWLALAHDATVRQIVLIDAPSVVGWQTWRELDNRYALGLLKASLSALAVSGSISEHLVDTYAHIMLAVLIEVALLIARSDDAANATKSGQEALEQLLSSLINGQAQ